jgi:hypothetical protein
MTAAPAAMPGERYGLLRERGTIVSTRPGWDPAAIEES